MIAWLCMIIPSQLKPSSAKVNPMSHEHRKEPSVLVHLCPQPPMLTRHSFISGNRNIQCTLLETLVATFTVEAVQCQSKSSVTGTREGASSVSACCLTSSIVGETLIDVFSNTRKMIESPLPHHPSYIPSQSRLLAARANPAPHEHWKDPSVLVHSCSQTSIRHSSTSDIPWSGEENKPDKIGC